LAVVGEIPASTSTEWESYRAYATETGIGISISAPERAGGPHRLQWAPISRPSNRTLIPRTAMKFVVNEIPALRLRQLFMHDPNGVKIEVNIREAVG